MKNRTRIVSFQNANTRMKYEITANNASIVKDIVKREHTIIEAVNTLYSIVNNIN
jgi:hypothetical protein